MGKTIKVMLVEDHPEYRDVIGLALQDERDIELIHQAGSSERAIHVLQDRSQDKVPDLMLLDLNLPGRSGLESISPLRSACPGLKVIVLTQSNREADVLQAIRLGASGYLLKSSTIEQILDAIRTVDSGGAVLGSGIAKYIMNSLQTSLPRDALEDVLSHRELEILALLGEGLVKKEIAHNLDISITTVATYIRRIYEKLDVQNAPAAINQAYQAGILPLAPTGDTTSKRGDR